MDSGCVFFFNDTATTEIYTLSLHDALPIFVEVNFREGQPVRKGAVLFRIDPRPYEAALRQAEANALRDAARSEEHTSELQSQSNLVCRLLLEKKRTQSQRPRTTREPTRRRD